jgi:hydroxypyruvate isomerase
MANGNIKQAIAAWCFTDLGEKWSLEKLCQVASELSVPALDVVSPGDFPLIKKYGLVSACTTSHLFIRGMNNPAHWDECLGALRTSIEANAAEGFKNVITFSGFADTSDENGSRVSYEEGVKNCVEGYKQVVGQAEKSGVTICLEPLNTRDPADMKGHPGYQLDHTDSCMEVIKKVGSPSLKFLYDAYHVQIMDGDLIRRIRELGEYIGFVQIAGNPGRNEPDETQEINYPAVMKALLEVGYNGYVAHEWIATGDAYEGLKKAVALIDV